MSDIHVFIKNIDLFQLSVTLKEKYDTVNAHKRQKFWVRTEDKGENDEEDS